ncbi:hypothetical protein [Halosimplex salinum]|uniref:hypothetical protein n=1 Tax=Halosimplex salinum TaxID=1710538 RepID=UPI000F473CE3|nr:hypothetical protein [Halosimplex salinum]
MQVYCTDGTVFECARYEVNEYGLVLYGTEKQRERERYDTKEAQQVGFVPHNRLWYVLPEGVTPQMGPGQPQPQPQQQQQPQSQSQSQQQSQPQPQQQRNRSAPQGQAQQAQPQERGPNAR